MHQILDSQKEERIVPLFRLGFRPFFLLGALFSCLAMLGWLGYRIFAQGAALVVDVSAWWSLLLLSIGFVVRLSAIIIGLRIAGEQLQIRAAIPLPDDDPRDDSMSHLLSITLLPFLGIYAVFDVITDAANHIQIDYYVFSGLTFERQVLSQFNPEGAGLAVADGAVGAHLRPELVEHSAVG